jgi:hypothetical protein
MRYLALVTDYDNTLAKDGRVTDLVVAKLRCLRESGRRVILVTGRRIDDLLSTCDCIDSFYFRGPHGKHNLKAQNLFIFSQLAEGIDEETWLYHLQRGDYSRWFREVIKDESLAEEARITERRKDLSSWDSQRLIREVIDRRYTLPE